MTDKEREYRRKCNEVERDLDRLLDMYFVAMLKDILKRQKEK